MPLTWNATKCSEVAMTKEEVKYTEYFCFLMIPVGINHLRVDDVEEFYWRLSVYERLFGNFYEKPSEKRAREKAEAVRRARKLARKRAQREV